MLKFSDFDLELVNNVYQNVGDVEIIGGIEFAVATLPKNSVAFIVDYDGNMIAATRDKDKKMDFETFISADGVKDYKIVGDWIKEFIEEHDFTQYGLIVETASDVYQVVN